MPMLALSIHTACAAAIFAHGFYTGVRLAPALLTLKLTHSPAAVGVVMMAYALLPALLAPHIGRAADRHGTRRLLHLCLGLLAASGAALMALPHHTAVLVVASLLVGLGFNTFAISIQKLIGSLPASALRPHEPAAERRKRHFGRLATATSISSLPAGVGLRRAGVWAGVDAGLHGCAVGRQQHLRGAPGLAPLKTQRSPRTVSPATSELSFWASERFPGELTWPRSPAPTQAPSRLC